MRTLDNKSLRQDLKVGTLLLYRECRTVSRMDLLLPRIFQLGCQKGANRGWSLGSRLNKQHIDLDLSATNGESRD